MHMSYFITFVPNMTNMLSLELAKLNFSHFDICHFDGDNHKWLFLAPTTCLGLFSICFCKAVCFYNGKSVETVTVAITKYVYLNRLSDQLSDVKCACQISSWCPDGSSVSSSRTHTQNFTKSLAQSWTYLHNMLPISYQCWQRPVQMNALQWQWWYCNPYWPLVTQLQWQLSSVASWTKWQISYGQISFLPSANDLSVLKSRFHTALPLRFQLIVSEHWFR